MKNDIIIRSHEKWQNNSTSYFDLMKFDLMIIPNSSLRLSIITKKFELFFSGDSSSPKLQLGLLLFELPRMPRFGFSKLVRMGRALLSASSLRREAGRRKALTVRLWQVPCQLRVCISPQSGSDLKNSIYNPYWHN